MQKSKDEDGKVIGARLREGSREQYDEIVDNP